MSLIVDASVAARWYLPEDGSEHAERILGSGVALLAPELVIVEIGNAVWKRVRKGEVSPETAVEIVNRAMSAFTELIPVVRLASDAMALSARHDHPIYDCLYLALALRERAALATADEPLAALANRIDIKVELLSTTT